MGSIRGSCLNTICPSHHFPKDSLGFNLLSYLLTSLSPPRLLYCTVVTLSNSVFPLLMMLLSLYTVHPLLLPDFLLYVAFSGVCKHFHLHHGLFFFYFTISSHASYLCICVCLVPCCRYIFLSLSIFFSFFLHLPSNWEADVDYSLLMFRQQIDLNGDLETT